MSTHTRSDDDQQPIIEGLDARNGWVGIRVTGEMNAEIAVSSLRQGLQLCEENACYRILFDAREIELTETFIGGYNLAKHFQQRTGLDHRYKCAVVYDPLHYPQERAEVMETVATNWGGPYLRMFSDLELAIDWLRGA